MKQYEPLTPKLALLLANPQTWVASVYPAAFGLLYCLWIGQPSRPAMAAALMTICVLMQSAVNTLNDHFDALRGNDSTEDALEQSDAVMLYHTLNPLHTFLLGIGYLGAAGLLGLWVIWQVGLAPLAVGVIGGVVVVLYSVGPLPLSYYPVGEVVSGFVMGGLIPLGVSAAVTDRLDWNILLLASPFILGIGLIMMTNNCSDIEKDRKAGRKTLPILLGRENARIVYQFFLCVWGGLIVVLPCTLFGPRGLTAPVAFLLLALRPFLKMAKAPLDQQNRVWQMKNINNANLTGNGAYLLALAVSLL